MDGPLPFSWRSRRLENVERLVVRPLDLVGDGVLPLDLVGVHPLDIGAVGIALLAGVGKVRQTTSRDGGRVVLLGHVVVDKVVA